MIASNQVVILPTHLFLYTPMPQLTRRTFTKSGITSLFALLAPASLSSCAVFRSRKRIPTAVLQDKLKGMILLGTYGDALGAYHEPRGLEGYTGNPADIMRLPKATVYQPPGSQAAPWWVWVRGDDLEEDVIGLPTDDSAFRLLILHPWLISLKKAQPSEAAFAEWMTARMNAERSFEVNQWQSRRQLQMQDWLIMFKDAERWQQAPTSNPTSFMPTKGNPFFRPAIPIVFGLFMYLELAALYAEYPPFEVMNHFSTFSRLDQEYAGSITGLFSGLMAGAVRVSDTKQPFHTWYFTSVNQLLNQTPPYKELIEQAFKSAWLLGTENQQQSERAFLDIMQTEIYEAPLPSNRDTVGFRVFDPLLFLKQITASVAYSGPDTTKALRLLASSPGDADTLPSMLGTLVGAWAGYNVLIDSNTSLDADLLEVEHTLSASFGYDVQDTSQKLALLAARITF